MPECTEKDIARCKASCCKYLNYFCDNIPEEIELCETRGMVVHQRGEKVIQLHLYHPCEFLDENDRCTKDERPAACHKYPDFDIRRMGLDNNEALTPDCLMEWRKGVWE